MEVLAEERMSKAIMSANYSQRIVQIHTVPNARAVVASTGSTPTELLRPCIDIYLPSVGQMNITTDHGSVDDEWALVDTNDHLPIF